MSDVRPIDGYFLLEDGTRFDGGKLFGELPGCGEAVFNTSHTGYQEIITDPSYCRQIITFTAPHIGNVGTNLSDFESTKIQAAGIIARSLSPYPQNWRSERSLVEFLAGTTIPLLTEVNTRAITLHLRERGAMRSGIFSSEISFDEALERVKSTPGMTGADLTSESSLEPQSEIKLSDSDSLWHKYTGDGEGLKVAVFDFGIKFNIFRELISRGCRYEIISVPEMDTYRPSSEINGVLLSNGPGDPAAVTGAIRTIRSLLESETPIFGICLGHQLLALAAGYETFKLPFGHRGANHPVLSIDTGSIEITSQNHGFAVSPDHNPNEWQITHTNLNDKTVEGISHKSKPFFSVQYHPEASPGPHEGQIYFDKFIRLMRNASK